MIEKYSISRNLRRHVERLHRRLIDEKQIEEKW